MATFQEFHGISLAANSWIENLFVEQLASDPAPVGPGRVWFNTTDKVFRQSSLDGTGGVVVRTFSTGEELAAAVASLTASIATEASTRAAADATLTSALSSEVTRATGAESELSLDIAAEITRATTAEAAETAARVAADTALSGSTSDQLATEISARTAADTALGIRVDGVQSELDTSQLAAGLNVDGTYTAPANTTYLGATTSLKGGVVALDTALTAEVARAGGVEASLASAIANEAQLRVDGDAALTTQLEAWVQTQIALDNTTDEARVAAEAALRIAADSAIQAELDAVEAAIGLDTAGNIIPVVGTNYLDGISSVFAGAFVLDTQVKSVADAVAAETAARAAADTVFQGNLDTERDDRIAAVGALQSEVNALEAGAGLESNGTYASPTASNYINSSVSLKDADYKLDAAIKVQADAITALGSSADGAVAAEAAARVAADAVLTSAVSAETAARVAADATLTSAVSDETTARQAADATLTSAVSAEAARAASVEGLLASLSTTAKTDLVSAINEVKALAGDGVSAFKNQVNAARYTETTSVAATSHTINHALGSTLVDVCVWIDRGDGVWRNDMVAVSLLDGNNVKVDLTAARNVRVTVEKMTAFA